MTILGGNERGIYTERLMDSSDITNFLISALPSVPFVLLHFLGIVLSIFLRQRIGRAWILSLIGFLLFLVAAFAQIAYLFWLYFLMDRTSYSIDVISTAAGLQSVVQSILSILGIIFLMMAIFMRREPRQNASTRET